MFYHNISLNCELYEEKKKSPITFIILLLSFVLIFTNACRKEDRQIQLEIEEFSSDGANTGSVLYFRMYNNREAEFDFYPNVEVPLSQSNLIRKTIILSEQDVGEIQSMTQGILEGLENSDLKKSYPPPPSNQPLSDAWSETVFGFNNGKGQMRSIVIQLERRRLMGSAYEQMYPKPLLRLLKKVTDIRTSFSNRR